MSGIGGIKGFGRFGGFLRINRRGIRAIAKREGGNEHNRAVREAVKDAIKEAGSKSLRDYSVQKIAEKTGLSPAIVRKRSRVKVTIRKDGIRVWFGLNNFNLSHLNPKQDKTGVTAGPVRVHGGFIIKKFNNQVFKRKGIKPLPIVKQVYDIRSKGKSAVEDVYRHLLQSFETTMYRNVQTRLRTRGLLD